jgi:hypothetical protein
MSYSSPLRLIPSRRAGRNPLSTGRRPSRSLCDNDRRPRRRRRIKRFFQGPVSLFTQPAKVSADRQASRFAKPRTGDPFARGPDVAIPRIHAHTSACPHRDAERPLPARSISRRAVEAAHSGLRLARVRAVSTHSGLHLSARRARLSPRSRRLDQAQIITLLRAPAEVVFGLSPFFSICTRHSQRAAHLADRDRAESCTRLGSSRSRQRLESVRETAATPYRSRLRLSAVPIPRSRRREKAASRSCFAGESAQPCERTAGLSVIPHALVSSSYFAKPTRCGTEHHRAPQVSRPPPGRLPLGRGDQGGRGSSQPTSASRVCRRPPAIRPRRAAARLTTHRPIERQTDAHAHSRVGVLFRARTPDP